MKIRHGVIIFIVLTIGITVLDGMYLPISLDLTEMLIQIFFILWLASLGLIVYLIIRNIIRAIKGAAVGAPKQKQDTAPPWEK